MNGAVCDATKAGSRFAAGYIKIYHPKKYHMQELIDRVAAEAGISAEQAQKSIEAVASFVKEKFPMMAGAVDQLFGTNN